MKYNAKNQMMAFSSDEEVSRFHNQLTDAMRMLMLNVGSGETASKEQDLKLTKKFFERYSVLAEALSSLRAHLPREGPREGPREADG